MNTIEFAGLLVCALVIGCWNLHGGGGGDLETDMGGDLGSDMVGDDTVGGPETTLGADLDVSGTCDECGPEGAWCEGETLVVCELDEQGCLTERRVDCGSLEGGFCDGEVEPAGCSSEVDPCAGLPNRCEAEDRTCEADHLIVCRADESGCLVESQTDCTNVEGGFCDSERDPVSCGVVSTVCEDSCEGESRGCVGETLVICETDETGCLAERSVSCGLLGGFCHMDADSAVCILDTEPCVDLANLCAGERRACDGNTLVVCTSDELGCLVETQVNCADVEGQVCNDEVDLARCEVDICGFVSNPCDTLGRSCDGDTLVVCDFDENGCLSQTEFDCTEDNLVCSDVDLASCVNPCASVEVCEEPAHCEGEALVLCEEDEHGCMVAVETIDCAAQDMQCDEASLECRGAICEDILHINCDTGWVSADTGNTHGPPPTATNQIDNYRCMSYYPGNEVAFAFVEDEDRHVTITSTRPGGEGDFDLFALSGSGSTCVHSDLECRDLSIGSTNIEQVDFDVTAGETVYIVYDLYASDTATTSFTLDIACDRLCGNGVLNDGEACDDGALINGDGCSSTCEVEEGWECNIEEPSACWVTWEVTQIDQAWGSIYEPSIQVDRFGDPHIAYSYYSTAEESVRYAHLDGTDWEIHTVVSGGDVGGQTSITLDTDGYLGDYPLIAYQDWNENRILKIARFVGSWSIDTIDDVGTINEPNLVWWPDGPDMVSYWDDASDELRYASGNGSRWTHVLIDTTSSRHSDLAVNHAGVPHVVYFSGDRIRFWDGATQTSVEYPIANVSYGKGIFLAFDHEDVPHIVTASSDEIIHVVGTHDSYEVERIDLGASYISNISAVLDSAGAPHMGLTDTVDGEGCIHYVRATESGWDDDMVACSSRDVQIALDENDRVHLTFISQDCDRLYHAFLPTGD